MVKPDFRIRSLVEILLVATIYFVLAKVSLMLQFQSSNATPVWPPSGFAFAMILLYGNKIAPGIMIGAFAVNLLIFLSNHTCTLPTAIILSIVISIGNTCEAIVGNYMLRKSLPHNKHKLFFKKINNLFLFSFVSLGVCVISSLTGVTAIFVAQIISIDVFKDVFLTWWMGDVSGILLVTPLILIWADSIKTQSPIFSPSSRRQIKSFGLFVVVVLVSGIIFDNWFSPPILFRWSFWTIPVLVWAALRFSQRETITAIAVCSTIAVWGTVNGSGPFASPDLNNALLTLQSFISIITVTKLALNISVIDRKRTEAMLRDTGNRLEMRVRERTIELENAANLLREKNKELQQTNEELSSFAHIASHDLQEPLRKIQMFSKLIMEKEFGDLSETAQDYFSRMEGAANRMQRLILDLLAYSRTNTAEKIFDEADLNLLLEKVEGEMQEKIAESKTIIESATLPKLNVIVFQFQQLFTNLISNAIKFAKANEPPRILIGYDIVKGSEINEEHIDPEKMYHHISFKDNGIGFKPEFNKQVFQIFYRLHPQKEYPGTGIGLSICKKIVENHGGILTANGEPGVGATFNIYIPF